MRWISIHTAMMIGTLVLLYAVNQLVNATLNVYYVSIIVQCGIFIILAVSLNLVNGITGQFSIGHAGFYAIGAYVAAAWTTLWQPIFVRHFPLLAMATESGQAIRSGEVLNLLIAIVLGFIAAGCAGFLVGLPSLRLRGDYLAIVTLGFGEVIRVLLLNIDAVGGARGINGIPTLVSSGDLSIFWVFLFVVLVVALSRNLMQSVRGLTWLAVREDEVAADAMGVNTTQVKVTAFIIGSAFAGVAGALYAHFNTGISPDAFGMDTSIIITTMVVLGGTGSVTGSIMAATLLTAMPELLRFLKDYRLTIFSFTLVIIMLTRPQGIFGHLEIGFGTFRRKKRLMREGGVSQ